MSRYLAHSTFSGGFFRPSRALTTASTSTSTNSSEEAFLPSVKSSSRSSAPRPSTCSTVVRPRSSTALRALAIVRCEHPAIASISR